MVASISIGAKTWKVFQFSSEFQSEAIIQFSIHNEISWEKKWKKPWKPECSQGSQREVGWQSCRVRSSEHSYLKSKEIQNEKKADLASECNLK